MKLKLTGFKYYGFDASTVGKGNMFWLVKEENKKGTDGIAWRAEYPRGTKVGYMPEVKSVEGWKRPCFDTKVAIRGIRKHAPDLVKCVVINSGPDWVELEIIGKG